MGDLRKSVEQPGMDRWAELSGDFNPLHCDPAYAAATRYGGTILHGHLTIAWLNEWALREWGAPWLSHGHLDGLRFRAPLRPGIGYVVRAEPVEGLRAAAALSVLLEDGTAGVTATARIGDGA